MIRVEIEDTIARPIDQVFDRLVDIEGYNQWLPRRGLFVSCRQDTDGPVAVGTVYHDTTRFGTVRGEVRELDPPLRVTFRYTVRLLGRTVMEGWPAYTLAPAGSHATRLRHVAEARLFGPARLLRPLIRRLARNERRRTVAALKTSLEAGP
ncbi:MAG: SRPBCC family protein [Gemmatimonadota bacterium]